MPRSPRRPSNCARTSPASCKPSHCRWFRKEPSFKCPSGAHCSKSPAAKPPPTPPFANRIGRPAAIRAVGAANGANPIPIVIPCHRVIGANGSMTGFGGGIDIKRKLLALEARVAGADAFLRDVDPVESEKQSACAVRCARLIASSAMKGPRAVHPGRASSGRRKLQTYPQAQWSEPTGAVA
jgi:O-6-methylguanine DNA methyltransferase